METFLVAALGAIPLLNMASGSGGSVASYLSTAAALALWAWPQQSGALTRPSAASNYATFVALMCLPTVAVVLSQWAKNGWSSSDIDRALRLGPSVGILLFALLRVDTQKLRLAILGILAAAIIGAGTVIELSLTTSGRPITGDYNAVSYANLLLLFGCISLYSMAIPFSSYPRVEKGLKVLIAAVAWVAVILTFTRSSWLAFPIFAAIGLVLFFPSIRPARLVAAILVVTAAASALALSASGFRERVYLAQREIHECLGPNDRTDSSVCIRVQLARAAWHMFQQDPWLGSGNGKRYEQSLPKLQQAGMVSKYVAENFGETHNDMLMALASYGLVGGLALLIIYFVPATIFFRRLRAPLSMPVRAAAAMGLALCLSFVVFGFTELMFRGMRTVSMYAMLIALFLALSHPRSVP
ncbi:O-antigen ligase family protein [Achromobacter spanius]|uniref:O-antigen ligase family protein n=1 Tax=Achromobacter spanius TaxID=217203 RepID=UPI00222706A0|nr:O-antigen ligase family protein [Achromobacter spanius]MCW3151061.1 O-antigen ligase family protein [Achromobacter spanius]